MASPPPEYRTDSVACIGGYGDLGTGALVSISCFSVSPAGCCSKLLGVELPPMMLLASQELSARAATRNQHLRGGAQSFVPEITSNIWVLTWQRPLKTVRGCILYC